MTGSVLVNAAVLRQRLLDLGLSDRRTAALIGVSQTTIRGTATSGAAGGQMSRRRCTGF